MTHTFHGGVHPNYMKRPDVPITVIAPPQQVVIPLIQHIGAPCKPLVQKGDLVKMGQKIGENPAPVSAPVHASVSGKVVAVEPRPHPLGDMIPSIVIENDGLDTPAFMEPLTEQQLKDPDAILERIREAGVVGMGGAMFPTAFKIKGGIGKVDKLIINGAECEPYLNGDHLTMLNFPEQLLRGIELVRIASGVEKAYYGIEVNKQDAIDLLNSLHPEKYGIEIVPEKVKYPQGGEKMQVKAVTGREVKPGGLPSGVGANVVSTRTCYAIYQACYEGKPVIERIVTVSGSALKDTVNALTRVGTPFGYLAEQCGGFVKTPRKIVLGGPMMGICATSFEAPTIKGTAGVLFFTEEEDRHVDEPTCIRCGKCITVCPMKLEPVFLYMYYSKGDYDMLEKYHVMDCFECGSCSYNCPARMPLTHAFKTAKLMFQARAAKEKAKAEAAAAKEAKQ
ncbi:MAG: electron transport complex subunit RsxC [Oscillospiraceae bacterium]|jgi:electron transport complex protein RnfC|nr:electron transport complex subunit RsxC [Oscillospiraceae bacterium]